MKPKVDRQIDFSRSTATLHRLLPRFPIVRQGYDRVAVDEHITELEAAIAAAHEEILELRARTPERTDIVTEIERLGEQTSAILITAHDAANETVTLARTEADTCIADAASYAAALREEAKVERARAETEINALRGERARLIAEIQSTAHALSSLASAAAAR